MERKLRTFKDIFGGMQLGPITNEQALVAHEEIKGSHLVFSPEYVAEQSNIAHDDAIWQKFGKSLEREKKAPEMGV